MQMKPQVDKAAAEKLRDGDGGRAEHAAHGQAVAAEAPGDQAAPLEADTAQEKHAPVGIAAPQDLDEVVAGPAEHEQQQSAAQSGQTG